MSESQYHAPILDGQKVIPDSGQPKVTLHPGDGDILEENSITNQLEATAPIDVDVEKRDSGLGSNGASSRPQSVTKHSKRARLKSIGHDAKEKSKYVIASAKARAGLSTQPPAPSEGSYAEIDNNPAFDPNDPIGKERVTIGGTADKVLGKVYTAAKAVAHPQTAVKRKAASTAAVQDRPYLSQQADIEYLEAHDNLSRAKSSHSHTSDEGVSLDHIGRHHERIKHLDDIRDGQKVAWMTSHHIHRVMVTPKRIPSAPKTEDFYKLDDSTDKRYFDWRSYSFAYTRYQLKAFSLNRMGEVDPACEEPFSKENVTRLAERILISSSPWQSWFSNLRSIYRWEDPRKTAKWAFVWFFVWYLDYIGTFTLSYVVYIVVQNKFDTKRVENLRDSYDRAASDHQTAFRFNELIKRHGSSNWIDPLMEEAGPLIQMQISDIADFLEILTNFYDWRYPAKTWATLFWFAVAIPTGALTSKDYSMKIMWMFCYLSFFLGRPIASKHPQYRHVVNALKWIFWDIPTDSAWAMMYLRSKAQETRALIIAEKVEKEYDEKIANPSSIPYSGSLDVPDAREGPPVYISVEDKDQSDTASISSYATASSSTSILGGLDLMTFKCRYRSLPGHLIIYSDGLRFTRSSPFTSKSKELWRYSWMDLIELRKQSFPKIPKISSADGLEILVFDRGTGEGSDGFGYRNDHNLYDSHEKGKGGKRRAPHDADHQDDGDDAARQDTTLSLKLEAVQGRDRAFNCILGFSGLQFQVLQPLGEGMGKDKGKERKEKTMRARNVGTEDGIDDVDLAEHGGWSRGFFD